MARIVWVAMCLLIPWIADDPALAQSPSENAAAPSAEITIADLQNVVVTAQANYSGQIRWSGESVTHQFQQHGAFRITIGPGHAMRVVVENENRWDGQLKGRRRFDDKGTIGVPASNNEQIGVRRALWVLEGNTLTILRVYERGGRISKVVFSRSANGLSCTFTSSYAVESGAGNPRILAPEQGGYYDFIGVKQVPPSSCRVSQK